MSGSATDVIDEVMKEREALNESTKACPIISYYITITKVQKVGTIQWVTSAE